MKSVILICHLLSVGLWLGCVLTEALFERALLGQGPQAELTLAALHWRVDRWVEIPAFTAVVGTGLALWPGSAASDLLVWKVAGAGVAVAANLWCVGLVVKRLAQARRGDWIAFAATDHLQHKVGAVVLLGILLAGGLGILIAVQAP
ncbi:MAG: hypothetical protein Q8R67_16120 [Rhodoferax sp.]|nr:hypothetical protein [Rhodoferax sp.]MDP3653203.1 hypothetical protein [Rhodoferax sp.]